jgi:O-antigen/teichoic acid export membrane protein
LAGPKLFRSSALYAGGEMLAKVLLMGALAVWMHFVTPAEFGRLEILRSAFLILAIPLGLGLSAAAGRWFVELEPDRFQAFLSSCVAAITGLSGACAAALALSPPTAFSEGAYGRMLWLLTLLCAGLSAAQAPIRSTLVFQKRAGAHSIVVLTQAVVTVGAGSLLLLHYEQGVLGLLRGYLFGFAASAAVATLYARQQFALRLSGSLLRSGLTYGLPLVPHLLAHQVMTYADRVILEHFRGEEATGLYSGAYLFASGLTVIALSLNKATIPEVFRRTQVATDSDNADRDASREQLMRVFSHWLVIVVWLSATVSVLSPDLLRVLMPTAYRSAIPLIPWVVWGAGLHAMYLLPAASLLYQKRTSLISAVSLGAAALNLALNMFLIPSMGGVGAAIATVAAYAVLALGVWFAAFHSLGSPLSLRWGRLALILAAAVFVTAIVLHFAEPLPVGPRVALKVLLVAWSGVAIAKRSGSTLRQNLA